MAFENQLIKQIVTRGKVKNMVCIANSTIDSIDAGGAVWENITGNTLFLC
jgi:hypothetical protein